MAAGLASGLSAAQLAAFYDEYGAGVFRPRLRARTIWGLFASRYSADRLKLVLEETLGERTLGEVAVPLILPAVDIDNGCVHVFKSNYHYQFVRDRDVRLSDAVLASCSAPTYFDPHRIDAYQLADGGLWANNPSLVAAVDAHYRLGVALADIRVLSVGTGTSRAFYPRSEGRWRDRLIRSWQGWGFATRWRRTKLINLILNLASTSAHNTLCLLLGESPEESHQVLRLTFESDRPLPMDAVRKGDDWVAEADLKFTHNSARIADFLSLNGD